MGAASCRDKAINRQRANYRREGAPPTSRNVLWERRWYALWVLAAIKPSTGTGQTDRREGAPPTRAAFSDLGQRTPAFQAYHPGYPKGMLTGRLRGGMHCGSDAPVAIKPSAGSGQTYRREGAPPTTAVFSDLRKAKRPDNGLLRVGMYCGGDVGMPSGCSPR